MNIRATIVCLPIQNLYNTLTFYKNVFGLPDIQIEEGMITVELPNLSLFLMEKNAFETYSRKASRGVQLPKDNVGAIISCALLTKEGCRFSFRECTKLWRNSNQQSVD